MSKQGKGGKDVAGLGLEYSAAGRRQLKRENKAEGPEVKERREFLEKLRGVLLEHRYFVGWEVGLQGPAGDVECWVGAGRVPVMLLQVYDDLSGIELYAPLTKEMTYEGTLDAVESACLPLESSQSLNTQATPTPDGEKLVPAGGSQVCPKCGASLSSNGFILWCSNPTDSHVFEYVESKTAPDTVKVCNCHPVRGIHAVFCPLNKRTAPAAAVGYCRTLGHWNQHARGPECKDWRTRPHTETDVNRWARIASTIGELRAALKAEYGCDFAFTILGHGNILAASNLVNGEVLATGELWNHRICSCGADQSYREQRYCGDCGAPYDETDAVPAP